MRTVIARIFDYSADGIIAGESTEFANGITELAFRTLR